MGRIVDNPYESPTDISTNGVTPNRPSHARRFTIAFAWLVAGAALGVALAAGLIAVGATDSQEWIPYGALYLCTTVLGAWGARSQGLPTGAVKVYPLVSVPLRFLQPSISHRGHDAWEDFGFLILVAGCVVIVGLIGTLYEVVSQWYETKTSQHSE
mgnify:CR=1 FL=1